MQFERAQFCSRTRRRRNTVKRGQSLMNASAHPGRTKPAHAFTVNELLISITCLAVLAAVLLPALAKSKARSSSIGCANCMKQIGLAFGTWSLDNNDRFPMQVSVTNGGTMELVAGGAVYPHFQVMSNELSTPKILLCPNDNKRGFATNFLELRDTNLSYLLNVDSSNGDGSSLLCGDRNITNRRTAGRWASLTKANTIGWTKEMHMGKGYLAFGDARVDLFKNGSVGEAIKIGDGITNRLAVP